MTIDQKVLTISIYYGYYFVFLGGLYCIGFYRIASKVITFIYRKN